METATRRIKRGWMNLKVTAIKDETYDTKTFVLVDAEEGGCQFDYVPGQYLTFRFDNITEKPLVRSYTMSSSPCQQGFVAFTVKRVSDGYISNWLCDEVQVGTILRARGPIGKFCYDPRTDLPHLFMIAAGSGVTPFISILREFAYRLGEPGAPQKMTLLVAYKSRKDLICWDELNEVRNIPGITIITSLTRENLPESDFWFGRPDEVMLDTVLGGSTEGITFMTCGPQALMDMSSGHLKRLHVPHEHIKTESFA